MLARRLVSILCARSVACIQESLFTVEYVQGVFGSQRPTIQRCLMTRTFSLSCVAQLPRSTHFAYIGDELQTPRQVNVLAKKEKKRRMIKSARQGLKSDLEDKLKEERLKEDIQDAIEMVRKRLHLKEKDVVNLNLSIDYLLSNTIPFSVISKMCSVAPRTFLLEIPVLKKKISVFKVNSIFEESIVKILKKNPKVLLRDVENTLTVKVEALRRLQLGLSVNDVVSIFERCPDIIEYLDAEKMLGKVKCLEKEVGFSKKQVRKILLKYPAVLTMSMTSIVEKINFCRSKFNIDLDEIVKYPRILQSRLDRLKQRYGYLEQEKIIGQDIKVRGWAFKGIAANSDVYFAEKIAHKPLKKLRDYQAKWKEDSKASLEISKSS